MSLPSARKGMGWALGLILLIALVAFAAWAFASPAYSADRLASGFARFGDLRSADVSEAELPQIARGIAGYLRGELPTSQVHISRHGALQDAFSQRELDHMPDVKRLTDWARRIWRLGLAALGLLLVIGLSAIKARGAGFLRLLGKSLLGAGLVFLGMLAILVLWSLLDFTGLFYRLHEWLFPNDFWQLDPGQHLMIQLMPEPFFVDYAASSLKRLAWLLLVFPLAALLMRWPLKRVDR